MRVPVAIAAALISLPMWSQAHSQKCEPWTIAQQTYRAFGERLVVYVGAINRGPAFTVRVLVGSYRRPFLASTGILSEPNLDKLLTQRPDISQHRIDWTPRAKGVLTVTDDGRSVTVRVLKPSATDVVGEVCR